MCSTSFVRWPTGVNVLQQPETFTWRETFSSFRNDTNSETNATETCCRFNKRAAEIKTKHMKNKHAANTEMMQSQKHRSQHSGIMNKLFFLSAACFCRCMCFKMFLSATILPKRIRHHCFVFFCLCFICMCLILDVFFRYDAGDSNVYQPIK